MDSASSKLSLISNIFVDNHADEDKAVYICGVYETIANNRFGTNNPNFNEDKYLVEWHRVGSNDKRSDNSFLQLHIRADKYEVFETNATVTAYFADCNGNNFTGKLTGLNGLFFSDISGDEFLSYDAGDNKVTAVVTVKDAPKHVITAQVDNQNVSLTLNQKGNFTWLQEQIATADGIYNLSRDLIYSYGIDKNYEGIVISKPVRINGNGHTLDGVGFARIFNIQSNDVIIDNITLVNARDSFDIGGGAILINGVSNVVINNSRFANNAARGFGGVIYSKDGNNFTIMNCQITDNYNSQYGGGAVVIETPNSRIVNTLFKNNSAEKYAGALGIFADNITVDRCEFTNNSAQGFDFSGAAISNSGENVIISNSIFLNNKAQANRFNYDVQDDILKLTMEGCNDFINAISSDNNIKFSNITYWDGKITTSDNPPYSSNESGITFTLEIFNQDNQIVKMVTLVTNNVGEATFDLSNLPNGNYTFKAIHSDDSYYAHVESKGKFSYEKIIKNSTSVKINIDDGKQFKYGEVIIPFEVVNGTEVEIFITNEDSSKVFLNTVTTQKQITCDLPASDENYVISIYNWGDKTHDSSYDHKTFKVLKLNSTVSIDPISNVEYGSNVTVSFEGDGTSYNVTVYDENDKMVFSQVTNQTSVNIAGLDIGEYNVIVVNLGSTNQPKAVHQQYSEYLRTIM